MFRAAFATLVAATLDLGPAHTQALADSCPESCIAFYSDPAACSTEPRRDSTLCYYKFPYDCCYRICTRAAYDLPAGLVEASGYAEWDGAFGGTATARDRFTLVGPELPEPVAFTAELHVVGSASYRGYGHTFVHGSRARGADNPSRSGRKMASSLTKCSRCR